MLEFIAGFTILSFLIAIVIFDLFQFVMIYASNFQIQKQKSHALRILLINPSSIYNHDESYTVAHAQSMLECKILLMFRKYKQLQKYKTYCITSQTIVSNKRISFRHISEHILIGVFLHFPALVGPNTEMVSGETSSFIEFTTPTSFFTNLTQKKTNTHEIDKTNAIFFNLHPDNEHVLHVKENPILLISMRSNCA